MSVDTDTRLQRPAGITPADLAETPPDLRGVVAQTLADFAPFVPAGRPYDGQHRAPERPEPAGLLGRALHALGLRGRR